MGGRTTTTVEILALDGVLDAALGVTRDVLSAANRLATASGRAAPFAMRLVATRDTVTTGTGLRVAVDGRLGHSRARPDVLVVLGMNLPTATEIDAAMDTSAVQGAVRAIARMAAANVLVLASCSGTFVVAESKLLEGKSAATSWWLAPHFRRRYPNVDLRTDCMVVPSTGVVTAGAALSQVDLMLWLVRRIAGPTIAHLCSRYLVVDERPTQARYALVDHLVHSNAAVTRAERFARGALHRPIDTQDLARAARTSVRTLERRFDEALGMSPARWLRRLRAERAAHLLATTDMTLSDVAEAIGYEDTSTLWRLLKHEMGTSAKALRRRPGESTAPR